MLILGLEDGRGLVAVELKGSCDGMFAMIETVAHLSGSHGRD